MTLELRSTRARGRLSAWHHFADCDGLRGARPPRVKVVEVGEVDGQRVCYRAGKQVGFMCELCWARAQVQVQVDELLAGLEQPVQPRAFWAEVRRRGLTRWMVQREVERRTLAAIL